MFLRWLEYLVFVLIALVFATQIFVPMWQGKRLFPIFRSRQRQLERKLAAAREEATEATLDRQLGEERERLNRLRQESKGEGGTSGLGS